MSYLEAPCCDFLFGEAEEDHENISRYGLLRQGFRPDTGHLLITHTGSVKRFDVCLFNVCHPEVFNTYMNI